jgi:hypothetical protein
MSFVGFKIAGARSNALQANRSAFSLGHIIQKSTLTCQTVSEFIRSEHSLFSCAIGAIFSLHWWTLHRTVGAKDAAVALLGVQHCLAAGAFVENLASASWHRLALSEAADRTLQHRFQKNVDHIDVLVSATKKGIVSPPRTEYPVSIRLVSTIQKPRTSKSVGSLL